MKIQQKQIQAPAKIGTQLKIIPIIQDLDAQTCFIQYIIQTDNGEIIENERFELTTEQYNGWGYDNTYLEDIVLQRLNLQREIE